MRLRIGERLSEWVTEVMQQFNIHHLLCTSTWLKCSIKLNNLDITGFFNIDDLCNLAY